MSKVSKHMATILEDQDDGAADHETGAPQASSPDVDDSIKLTEISDIVAKYAVVDTVFEDDSHDDESTEDAEADGGEDVAEPAEIADETDADIFAQAEHEPDHGPLPARAAESFLPERPKVVFRRPRVDDDLYSNWSDKSNQVFDDMDESNVHDLSDEREQRAEHIEAAEIVSGHKRSLTRSVALSIGVPVVGGALFALAFYAQDDIKPADMWNWIASAGTTQTVSNDTPTPNFVQHPAARVPTKSEERVTSAPEQPAATSPESGSVRASSEPEPQVQQTETAEAPEPDATPAVAPSAGQVFMAKLTVTDAQGSSLEPIPLSLAVAPASPDQKLRIRISGLPEGARLSGGTDLSNGEWLLQQNELEDLSMNLAPGFSGQITLMAEVIDDATHIQAAPSQTVAVNVVPDQLSVEPAAAPAESAPQSFAEQDDLPTPQETLTVPQPDGPTQITPSASPFAELRVATPNEGETPDAPQVAALEPATQTDAQVDEAPAETTTNAALLEENTLIAKGNEFMTNGDIIAARLFYERALKNGDPRAATALGKSYDPVMFEQLRVHGVAPDPNQAAEWYRKGAEGGDSVASEYLQTLNAWMKQ